MIAGPPADPPAQTLSRGIRVLEALAAAPTSLRIDDLARELGLHRSITYRLVRTLEAHRLVHREPDGRYRPGAGLAVLARAVSRDLQGVAVPELAAVAEELAMTCFVAVADGEECVTLASVEPRQATASVVQRPGTRHPLDRGAPGLALLGVLGVLGVPAGRRSLARRVEVARRDGYATSHDEVIAGLSSVAVALPSASPSASGGEAAAVAVVYVTSRRSPAAIARRLQVAAAAIAERLA